MTISGMKTAIFVRQNMANSPVKSRLLSQDLLPFFGRLLTAFLVPILTVLVTSKKLRSALDASPWLVSDKTSILFWTNHDGNPRPSCLVFLLPNSVFLSGHLVQALTGICVHHAAFGRHPIPSTLERDWDGGWMLLGAS